MQRLKISIILFLLPIFVFAQQAPLLIDRADMMLSITNKTVYKEDNARKFTFETISLDSTFKPMEQELYRIGGNRMRNSWVKFQVQKNVSNDIYLELSTSITDTLYLYTVSSIGVVTMQQQGKNFPFSERPVKTSRHVFPLNDKQNELTTYYLNMRSQYPLSVRMRLGTDRAFIKNNQIHNILRGIFVGIIAIIALFNLFFFVSLRKSFYGYYMGYALFMLATNLRFDGYLYEYLHPDFPEFNYIGLYFHGFAGVFGVFFSRTFLYTQKYTPLLDKGLLVFCGLYVVNMLLVPFGFHELSVEMVYFLTMLFNFYLIVTSIAVYRNGYLIARYFVAGIVCLTGCISTFALYNMGIIGGGIIVQNIMYLGIVLEAILYFMAVVDRYAVLRKEKIDVQERMIESFRQNERLMKEKNRLLEQSAHTRGQEIEMMQSKLSEYAQKLIKSNQELTDFAHIASHDLRAPIRNIGSFTQLLEKRVGGQLDERSLEYFGFIKTNVRQSTKLIEDLLNYSKIDKNIGDAQSIDLNNILLLVNNNLQSFIAERNAQIIYKDLPTLKGHTSLIVQLFQNLINNGLKYNKSDKPTVTIAADVFDDEMTFKVTDNGIGIAAQYQDQVFGMFRRLHSASEYEGSGIGLAFCQRIVATYGGVIWFESEEGQGTTFFFTLPKAVGRLKSDTIEADIQVPELVNS